MADQDVTITLKTLGLNTIAEGEKRVKALRAEVKNLDTNSKEFDRDAAHLVKTVDALNAAKQRITSTAGRVSQSYIQMGTALRSSQMAATNFSRVMQDMPFGLMAIQNNIEPLLMSFSALKTEAAAAGMSMRTALLGAMLGPGALIGALTMAVPLVSALSREFGDLDTRIKNSGNAITEMRRQMGLVSDKDWAAFVAGKLGSAQAAAASAEGVGIGDFLRQAFMGAGGAAFYRTARIGETSRAVTETAQKYGLGPYQMPEVETTGTRTPFTWRYGGRVGGMSPLGVGQNKQYQQALGGFRRSSGAAATAGVSTDMMMPDLTTPWQSLSLSLGHTLSSALANGFMRGFQTGESLLKSFTDAVMSSLLGIAAQQTSIYAVSGLLSLIPGVGAFGTIATALGGLFSAGTARPGISQTGGGVGGQLESINQSIQALDLRVDNVGLHMAVSRGKLLKEAR